MANEKRITKRDRFAEIRAILETVEGADALIEFVDNEVTLLDRKAEKAKSGDRKASATQLANEGLKAEILADMEVGKAYSVGEIRKTIECCIGLSSQKVTPLMKQLAESGAVEKTVEKGVTYYTKPETEEVEE